MGPSDFQKFPQAIDDFMLPSVSRWHNYGNALYARSAATRFALPIRAPLDDQFLVGGLGVEDQQNVFRPSPDVTACDFLWGHRGRLLIRTENK
jgi:hypothetical protein